MSVVEALREKLTQELDATHVEIVDNSWQHVGHAGATGAEGTHLQIRIVSPRFEGMPLMEQHRLVHQALQEAREKHLHALELKTLTPQAWEQQRVSR